MGKAIWISIPSKLSPFGLWQFPYPPFPLLTWLSAVLRDICSWNIFGLIFFSRSCLLVNLQSIFCMLQAPTSLQKHLSCFWVLVVLLLWFIKAAAALFSDAVVFKLLVNSLENFRIWSRFQKLRPTKVVTYMWIGKEEHSKKKKKKDVIVPAFKIVSGCCTSWFKVIHQIWRVENGYTPLNLVIFLYIKWPWPSRLGWKSLGFPCTEKKWWMLIRMPNFETGKESLLTSKSTAI